MSNLVGKGFSTLSVVLRPKVMHSWVRNLWVMPSSWPNIQICFEESSRALAIPLTTKWLPSLRNSILYQRCSFMRDFQSHERVRQPLSESGPFQSPLWPKHLPNLRILLCTVSSIADHSLWLISYHNEKHISQIEGISWSEFFLLKTDVLTLVWRMCRENEPGPSPKSLSSGTFYHLKYHKVTKKYSGRVISEVTRPTEAQHRVWELVTAGLDMDNTEIIVDFMANHIIWLKR